MPETTAPPAAAGLPLPAGPVLVAETPAVQARADAIKAIIAPAMRAAAADPSVPTSNLSGEVLPNIDATALAAAQNPQMVSALGMERPVQSPITWLMVSGGLMAAIETVKVFVGALPFDLGTFPFEDFFQQLGYVAAFLAGLFARWLPGLKPLFWKEPGKPNWGSWAFVAAVLAVVVVSVAWLA